MRKNAILFTTVLSAGTLARGAADEAPLPPAAPALGYGVTVETPVSAPDLPSYWFQARAGVVAPNGRLEKVVLTAQLLDDAGTHMYHGLASTWSGDAGKAWQELAPQPAVDRRTVDGDLSEAPVDMTPLWHRKTGKLLLTGATFLLSSRLQRHVPDGGSSTIYSVYDAERNAWGECRKLALPDRPDFGYARAGCTQAVERPDGDILLPIYFGGGGNDGNHKSTVVRCRFDGAALSYVENGTEFSLDIKRGLGEPSLACFDGAYYLTMRNDDGAYFAAGADGLHFGELRPWTFDDGQPLGSCNTQQHWVTHSDGLFLVYTRNRAHNDEVPRNRAPLFMARFDPQRGCLLRATETVLLPKVGASEFGNFGVCNVDANQTWVVAARGRPRPGEPSIYIARIAWTKPNQLAPRAAAN